MGDELQPLFCPESRPNPEMLKKWPSVARNRIVYGINTWGVFHDKSGAASGWLEESVPGDGWRYNILVQHAISDPGEFVLVFDDKHYAAPTNHPFVDPSSWTRGTGRPWTIHDIGRRVNILGGDLHSEAASPAVLMDRFSSDLLFAHSWEETW